MTIPSELTTFKGPFESHNPILILSTSYICSALQLPLPETAPSRQRRAHDQQNRNADCLRPFCYEKLRIIPGGAEEERTAHHPCGKEASHSNKQRERLK